MTQASGVRARNLFAFEPGRSRLQPLLAPIPVGPDHADFAGLILGTLDPTTDAPVVWLVHLGTPGSSNDSITAVDVTLPAWGAAATTHATSWRAPGISIRERLLGIAEAGRAPCVVDPRYPVELGGGCEPGGYAYDKKKYFVLTSETDQHQRVFFRLGLWTTNSNTIVDEISDIWATIPNSDRVFLEPQLDSLSGIVHDPTTRSILIGDATNAMIWVFGYDRVERGHAPITFKNAIRAPGGVSCLAFDPAQNALWSGGVRLPVDLARD